MLYLANILCKNAAFILPFKSNLVIALNPSELFPQEVSLAPDYLTGRVVNGSAFTLKHDQIALITFIVHLFFSRIAEIQTKSE